MKRNCSRAATGLAIALICILVSFGSSSPMRAASTQGRPAGDHETSQHAKGQSKSTATTLTVHVLPTNDGAGHGLGMYADRYPKSVSIPNAGAFAGEIAAYGAAYRVWIGPKGWTGSAAVGYDGSTGVNLYPPNGSAKSGPRFYYEDSGGCAGCALDEAAPYLPCAMQEYEGLFDSPIVSTVPRGAKVVTFSPSLAMYTGFEVGGLLVRGVVHFRCGTSDYFAQRAEFVLPRSDVNLLHFLMHTFIRREKLK